MADGQNKLQARYWIATLLFAFCIAAYIVQSQNKLQARYWIATSSIDTTLPSTICRWRQNKLQARYWIATQNPGSSILRRTGVKINSRRDTGLRHVSLSLLSRAGTVKINSRRDTGLRPHDHDQSCHPLLLAVKINSRRDTGLRLIERARSGVLPTGTVKINSRRDTGLRHLPTGEVRKNGGEGQNKLQARYWIATILPGTGSSSYVISRQNKLQARYWIATVPEFRCSSTPSIIVKINSRRDTGLRLSARRRTRRTFPRSK